MTAKVRPLDRARIRLSDPVLDKVAYLARLAGVRCSDIVNYVLTEVLTDDGQPEAPPAAAPPAPAPSRVAARVQPATVIPITRKQRGRVPARMAMAELRARATDVRQHARTVRARATEAREAAGRARSRAQAALVAVGLFGHF